MREPFLEAPLPTRTIFLPKYTSESLNWLEGFWGHTKDTFFSRMLTKKRESFYTEAVRRLWQLRRPSTLRILLRPAPPP